MGLLFWKRILLNRYVLYEPRQYEFCEEETVQDSGRRKLQRLKLRARKLPRLLRRRRLGKRPPLNRSPKPRRLKRRLNPPRRNLGKTRRRRLKSLQMKAQRLRRMPKTRVTLKLQKRRK